MTTITDVTALAQSYADQAAAAARADEQDRAAVRVAALQAQLDAVEDEFAAYKASHPDVTVPPVPPVESGLPPLIGSSAPPNLWEARKQAVEAFGGKYEARRLFFQSLTEDPTAMLNACAAQGLVPVISFKPGSYTWAQIAAGNADTALKTIGARLKAFGKPVFMAIHHEPDQQSDPEDVGEGGTGVDFAKMQAHAADVIHATAPNVKFGPILNGWWFTAQARGFSDAQIEVWLPKSTRDKLDFIAADDYNTKDSTERAVDRIKRRVAWMGRVGYTGPTGVGETNGWVPADLTTVFAYAKTEPKFAGSFVLVWDSSGTTYQPLSSTGMVDDMGAIVKGWRA